MPPIPDPLPGLWVCGQTSVDLFAADADFAVDAPQWSWDSRTATDLPEERRDWFSSTDEVKPVSLDGVPCVLISSSWRGAVGLVRRIDHAVLFTLALPNAHSGELLPGGWIACAGSDGSDALVIHQVSAGVLAEGERARFALPHAHGAVFEPGRSLLWTCGRQVVQAYRWESTRDSFTCVRACEIALPTDQAHDLMPDPFGGGLIVTTEHKVWHLDPLSHTITPYAPIADANDVKGISVEASSGTLAMVKAPGGGCWWTDHVRLLARNGTEERRTIPGRKLYKVRWDQPSRLETARSAPR